MLKEGEQVKYKDLLYAMLLPSGNDAAKTIDIFKEKQFDYLIVDLPKRSECYYKKLNARRNRVAVNKETIKYVAHLARIELEAGASFVYGRLALILYTIETSRRNSEEMVCLSNS